MLCAAAESKKRFILPGRIRVGRWSASTTRSTSTLLLVIWRFDFGCWDFFSLFFSQNALDTTFGQSGRSTAQRNLNWFVLSPGSQHVFSMILHHHVSMYQYSASLSALSFGHYSFEVLDFVNSRLKKSKQLSLTLMTAMHDKLTANTNVLV